VTEGQNVLAWGHSCSCSVAGGGARNRNRNRNRKAAPLAETTFAHDRLDVYRLAMKSGGGAETPAGYRVESDYEHEHRFAEQEHEAATEAEPRR
jgi:hypothetical protein